MESDLVVYVNITLTAMSGGPKSVSVGLASYRSLRHHHNVHTLRHSRSFNDPPNSAMHHSYERMRGVIDDHVTVFQIEATLNNDTFPASTAFLNKREWEWNLADQGRYLAVKRANELLPTKSRRRLWQATAAPYGVTGVNAGRPGAVHPLTIANVHRQQLTEVYRAGGRRDLRAALHLPVQRELDHEPDPGDVARARLLLQPVPEHAASCGPAARRSSTIRCRASSIPYTTRATSTSSTRC